MSQWTDRIRNHAVWAHLETLGPAIDQAIAVEGIAAADIDGIERVRTVLGYAGKRLAALDPVLAHTKPLDGLAAAAQAAATELQQFVADKNAVHVATANLHADGMLTWLGNLPAVVPLDDLTTIGQAAASYRATLEDLLNKALESNTRVHSKVSESNAKLAALDEALGKTNGGIEAARAELGKLANEIGQQRTVLTNLATEHQTQFAAAQESRAKDFLAAQTASQEAFVAATTEQGKQFQAAQTARQDTFAATAAEQQSQFSTAQAARQTEHSTTMSQHQQEFGAAQTERQEKFGALIADYTGKLAEQNVEFSRQRELALKAHQEDLAKLQAQYQEAAQKILDNIQDQKTQVEKLVGVVGNLAVTSGYQRTANQARITQWVWQAITVLALGGLIGVAYAVFAPLADGKFTWEAFASRILLSLTVGVLAAYAGSQADKFHQIEKRNRKLALELEAIGPYLAPLPKELQDKFRVDVGERSFGRHEDAAGKDHEKSPATVVDVVDRLAKSDGLKEIIANLTKAIRGSGS